MRSNSRKEFHMGKLAENVRTNLSPSGRIYTCRVEIVCEDDDDRKAIAALMATEGLSARAIARTIGVSEGTVWRHRRKECQCYKRVSA